MLDEKIDEYAEMHIENYHYKMLMNDTGKINPAQLATYFEFNKKN